MQIRWKQLNITLLWNFFDNVRNVFNDKMQNELALYGLCSKGEKLKIRLHVLHVATYVILTRCGESCKTLSIIIID